MSQSPGVAPMHVGICVSDIERSLRFYTEALGFVPDNSFDELGAPLDTLLEMPGVVLSVRQMQCGALRIELVHFDNVETLGPDGPRPMNQRGLTHLTFTVADLAAATARIEEFGGRVHAQTRIDAPFGSIVFCSDPDGTRIELMQAPAA